LRDRGLDKVSLRLLLNAPNQGFSGAPGGNSKLISLGLDLSNNPRKRSASCLSPATEILTYPEKTGPGFKLVFSTDQENWTMAKKRYTPETIIRKRVHFGSGLTDLCSLAKCCIIF
jgi:hypothetical protein